MASSLASQLAQVRSHNADRLSSSKSAEKSKAASYLFPPSVAATQDLQTLHGLGRNGWEELSTSDTSLAKWGQSTGCAELLFGDASRDLDRLTRTKEENRQLDSAISDFFDAIGDSLLDRSAAKCIEWLVRRFRIHEHNVEATLSLFLPYHETNEFVRMLQILDLANKPHLAFLLPVQKSGTRLPSSILISAATNSPSSTPSLSTLRWLIGSYSAQRGGHSVSRARNVARAFWLGCFVRICALWSGDANELERMGLTSSRGKRKGKIDDDAQLLLSVLLPAAVKLLTSEHSSPEDRVTSCMALCSIAAAFDLSQEAASSLLTSLANITSGAHRVLVAIFAASAVICAKQDQALEFTSDDRLAAPLLTDETAHAFAQRIAHAPSAAQQAKEACLLEAFSVQLCGTLCPLLASSASSDVATALGALFDDVRCLSSRSASRAAAQAIAVSAQERDSALKDLVASLRQRRPEVFDSAVALLKTRSGGKLGDDIEEFLWMVVTGSREHIVPNGIDKSQVLLSASDASGSARVLAIKRVFDSVASGSMTKNDSMAQQVLVEALRDEDEAVLEATYASHASLVGVVGLGKVVDIVLDQLGASSDGQNEESLQAMSMHWRFLLEHALRSTDVPPSSKTDIWTRYLLWQLLCAKSTKRASQAFYEVLSDIFAEDESPNWHARTLHGIAKAVQRPIAEGDWVRVNVVVAQVLSRQLGELQDQPTYNAICGALQETAFGLKSAPRKSSWSVLLLASMIPRLNAGRRLQSIQELLAKMRRRPAGMSLLQDTDLSSGTAFPDNIASALYRKPTAEQTLATSKSFLAHSMVSSISLEGCAVLGSASSDQTNVQELFAFCVEAASTSREAGSFLISKLLQRMEDSAIVFLASIWTREESYARSITGLAALQLAHSFLQAFDVEQGATRRFDFQTLVPAFMIALKSTDKQARLQALNCLSAISTVAQKIENEQQRGKHLQIYGYDVIYGPGSKEHLRYLETRDTERLLTDLVSAQESFENDPLFISAFLTSRINPRKDEGKKEIAYKVGVLQFLLSHVVCWGSAKQQISLLEMVESVHHHSKLESLLPLIKSAAAGADPPDALARLLFGAYNKSAKRMIENDTGGAWTTLKVALEGGSRQSQKYAAAALRDNLFASLRQEKQRDILEQVTRLVATSSKALPDELRTLPLHVAVNPEIITTLLSQFRSALSSQDSARTPAKRAREDAADTESPGRSIALLVEMLETLVSRRAILHAPLVAELFEVLRIGSEMLQSRATPAEHLVQFAMTALANTFDVADNSTAVTVTDALRVDVIVKIIKMPCRPQTVQQALLLLSNVGRLAPDLVLHQVMPVFTFVGDSMLQRDDDYSFTVIEKTLKSVLPPAADDLRAQNQKDGGQRFELLQRSRALLCVFTDAATHVPRHRRAAFFQFLARAMGPADFLGAICMLMVDRQAGKVSRLDSLSEMRDALQVPLLLFNRTKIDIDVQLSVIDDVWKEVDRNWTNHDKDPIEMQDYVFLDCVRGIEREHDQGRVDPLRRIVALMRFGAFAANALENTVDEERDLESDDERHRRDITLQKIIELALKMCAVSNASIASAAQDALDATMLLVSVPTLEHVVLSLFGSGESDRRHIGLVIIAKSFPNMSHQERKAATSFTVQAISTAQGLLKARGAPVEDMQTALDALGALAEDCRSSEHTALAKGVPELIRLSGSRSAKITLQAISILQRLVPHLGPRLIPSLGGVIAACCANVSSGITSEAPSVIPSLDLLSAVVKGVPAFASSHLPAIFSMYVAQAQLLQAPASRRLLSTVVSALPPNELLQATFSFYESAIKAGAGLPLFCLSIMQRSLKVLDRKKTLLHYKSIFRFLLQIMDIRRETLEGQGQFSELSGDDIDAIERQSVDCFLRLVLKLDESTFRPLFLRLCDWSLLDLADEAEEKRGSTVAATRARQVVLYKSLNQLLTHLGDLVVHYYANVLDGTIETLDALTQQGVDEDSLWSPLVESIRLSARVDRGAFWNEARVNKIVPVLAAQLTTPLLHASTSAEQAVGDAVSSLCKTVSIEACFKEANNRLLYLARDADSASSTGGYSAPSQHKRSHGTVRTSMRTRVAAIRSMERLWSTKGCDDALLNLVPETVPSIAELLQETDPTVQEAMMALVAAIEAVLGESLDAYVQ